MTLSKTLKAIFIGFLFGFGLTWALAFMIPFAMGLNSFEFIDSCSEDIYAMSILGGGLMCFGWPIIIAMGIKRRKREELEDAMKEYFRKRTEEDS